MTKSDFPIFTNNPNLVYLDNAATSQKPHEVISAIENFYKNTNANVHRGLYSLSENATELYEDARNTIANFLNAKFQEIVFTSGTTESINLLSKSIADLVIVNDSQDQILLTDFEHHSNLVPWQQIAQSKNISLAYVPIFDNFHINYLQLHKLLKRKTIKIFAFSAMSNVLGTIVPLEETIRTIRSISPQTLIVIDGAQYLQHHKIDVKKLDIDFLAFSGHKLMGPTGIGVFYGKEYLLNAMNPIKTGGGMITNIFREFSEWAELPNKFEAGTPNIAGAIGLANAINYLEKITYIQIEQKELALMDYFFEKLKSNNDLTIYGPNSTKNRGPVFSFNLGKYHSHDVAQILAEHNVAVRAGHHCAQILMREVLNVSSTVRASLSFYNDSNDIDLLFQAIDKVKSILK
jgi:cysteine desulfurase / selenocysteine lyase